MKKIIIMLAFALCSTVTSAMDANTVITTDKEWNAFLDALSMVESGGRDGIKTMDRGTYSYGRLQIKKAYLVDSGLSYTLEDVRVKKDVSYSVVRAYLERYARYYKRKTGKDATVEILARIHNGGPLGWKNPKTIPYVNKVKKHLI